MKRCIICGNMDEDSSAVCSMCGNPYVDMSERPVGADEAEQSGTQEASEEGEVEADAPESENAEGQEEPQPQEVNAEIAPENSKEQPEAKTPPESSGGQPDAEAMPESSGEQPEVETMPESSKEQLPEQAANSGHPTSGSRPVRRMRGGPQIYGQDELMNSNPELFANQGAIRRDVPPRSAGLMQGGMGRPMGQMPAGAGRPMGQAPRGAGRPMGQMPAGAARPSGQDFLSKRVMEIARKALKSPLFFLIVLLNTACVASSIAAIFLGELNYSQVVRLLNETDLPKQASGYVNTITHLLQQLDSGMIVQNIALHIPSILFCLGLWLVFITALAAKDRMSGVGFGFAKAAVILRMIVAGVVMLMVLIFTVTLVIAAWVSKDTQVIIVTAIVLVAAIVVTMMVIMYYFSYLATLKTCRLNADTGESYGKPSCYLAVLHIILALPSIIGILSGIVNMEISNIVGSAAELLWMILFAVWIFLYRGKMNELEE